MNDHRKNHEKNLRSRKQLNQIGDRNDEYAKDVLQDQIFSDSETEQEEPEINEESNSEEERDENPWITVQRRRKPSQNMSEEPSFKIKEVTFEAINTHRSQIYQRKKSNQNELTEMQKRRKPKERTTSPITRKTRSQGLAPEPMLPTRPLEYKKYTKRK